MFFVTVGFLINPRVFVESTINNLGLVSSIVLGLIIAKLLAALVATRAFHYTKHEGLIMWSLSLPQVAATLAAALVAYNAQNSAGERLIDEPVLNTVIVLMVITSVLGPILTESFGRRLVALSEIADHPTGATPSIR